MKKIRGVEYISYGAVRAEAAQHGEGSEDLMAPPST